MKQTVTQMSPKDMLIYNLNAQCDFSRVEEEALRQVSS